MSEFTSHLTVQILRDAHRCICDGCVQSGVQKKQSKKFKYSNIEVGPKSAWVHLISNTSGCKLKNVSTYLIEDNCKKISQFDQDLVEI